MILDRTFHPDEANQAFTTGRLLETGVYRYDPKDHHGPTLYYAASAIQKAAGNDGTATLDGTLLRCTPLLFSALTLVFVFLALRKIFKVASVKAGGLKSAVFALLLATSPIFVFFATDFIQEMLLAAFTAMMFWAATGYALHRSTPGKIKPGTWALLFGIAGGLAFATKETCVLAFAASVVAITVGCVLGRSQARIAGHPSPSVFRSFDAVLAIAGFALTATLFYSSFATNWQGVYNAFVAAPLSYVQRAAGNAVSEGAAYHVHPWWQYLKWLFGSKAFLAAYTATGTILGIFTLLRGKNGTDSNRNALKIAFAATAAYAATTALAYSAIPYKTPWCALQIHLPLLLSAFLGFAMCAPRGKACRIALTLFPLALLCENSMLSAMMWREPDSKEIPYNYASASPQVKDMARLVEDIVSEKEKAGNTFVAVAVPAEDTWPLPFYLRGLDARVGYWTQFEELEVLAALKRKPDIVVVPAEDGHKVQPLFPHLKNTKRFEMRHRVRMRVFW